MVFIHRSISPTAPGTRTAISAIPTLSHRIATDAIRQGAKRSASRIPRAFLHVPYRQGLIFRILGLIPFPSTISLLFA